MHTNSDYCEGSPSLVSAFQKSSVSELQRENNMFFVMYLVCGFEWKCLLSPRYSGRFYCLYYTITDHKCWLSFHTWSVNSMCAIFHIFSSRIYDLNQAKPKEFYRSMKKWSAMRKKMLEMVKMVLIKMVPSPILSSGAASSECYSLEMLRAITFVLFILPQRLGDESTEKTFRMKKL